MRSPRRLWFRPCVGTVKDDRSNGVPKHRSDFRQPWCPALILCGVVQQSRDSLIFVAVMFDNQAGGTAPLRSRASSALASDTDSKCHGTLTAETPSVGSWLVRPAWSG